MIPREARSACHYFTGSRAGAVCLACEYDWKGAEREFLYALKLGPEVSDIWLMYTGFYLRPTGLFNEAMAAAQKALELDPLSASRHNELGIQYELMGQNDRAIEQYRNALELDPNEIVTLSCFGNACLQMGRFDEAIEAMEKAVQFSRRSPILLGQLGMTYAQAGRTAEAKQLLIELQQLGETTYAPPLGFAYIYLGLGQTDRAFDWPEKAVEEHSPLLSRSHIIHQLRSHPRYHALLRKMNLQLTAGG